MGKLILIPTPIGNLEDITLRAIRCIKEADVVLAEDTRVTLKLLNHLQISKKVYPYHAHNEHKLLDTIVQKIEENSLTVLLSDAGTPAISDPGFLLVRACVDKHISVSCLPGPTAFVPALVMSAFPCDRFCFEGFLPHKKGRQTKVKEIENEERTCVLYESPHRIIKTLKLFQEFFDEQRKICVLREISKIYEQSIRGTVIEVLDYFSANEDKIKGEMVIVIEGKK
ncbi:MAG: 16S rRNA (cytidine(1402)-2'-O)-methyltransferase [Flavobacteriia bacterium]|nr:16S rRNA (cytidine(1402)-2'-O)-methyltransferase [Flavobacteriia bacterium]